MSALFAGCLPSLSDGDGLTGTDASTPVGDDGAMQPGKRDMAASSGVGDASVMHAPGDAAMQQGSYSDPTCPAPLLVVAVENLTMTGAPVWGAVMRYSLSATAPPAPCSSLTLQEGLSQYMRVASVLPNGSIFAGAADTISVIAPSTDTPVWTQSVPSPGGQSWSPVSAFPMIVGGQAIVAVGYNNGATAEISSIQNVVPYDAASGQPYLGSTSGNPNFWNTETDIVLGDVEGMTADPFNPSFVLAVDDSDLYAAVEVDPVAMKVYDEPPYIALAAGHDALSGIYSLFDGTHYRSVWIGTKSETGPDNIYYASDSSSVTSGIEGPITCHVAPCNTTGYHLVSVAPDPTDAGAFFAVCDGPDSGGGRALVRVDTSGTCTTIATDGKLSINDARTWGVGVFLR